MLCTANENCDHEKRLKDMETCVGAKISRKETYISIGVCAIGFLCFLGYLWLAVGAKADDAEMTQFKKETSEIMHRQELIMTRMEGVVGTSAAKIKGECERSQIEDKSIKKEHIDDRKEMNKKLDAMEKRVGQLEYCVNTP